MLGSLSMLALWLAPALAQTAGSFEKAGSTKVSAMMMFVGNDEKVYILDKAEGNEAQVNGHPAWGAVWDLATRQVDIMDVKTNVFCASGMHLPNGSFATFGGNGAVGKGGSLGSVTAPGGYSATYDEAYGDYEGQKAIRIVTPCKSGSDFTASDCAWFDDPAVLSMQKQRWYSAAEPRGDGTIVMIGGFANGGYINRNYPNVDPEFEGGAAEPTYEFFPSDGQTAKTMQFMIKTSGLNSYAHTYLLSSGKMFVQANISTMIWDIDSNTETALPDMPGGVARVYPASGAVAMLPLTPDNDYNPTILFCGGTDMPDEAWGNYSFPMINTWNYPASADCQRITPEPAGGATPAYEQDDDMLETRTMGQFTILPDGTLLVINGAVNGTAGYADATGETPKGSMPFGMSLAAGPVLTPAIYNPKAAKGSRWSNKGLGASTIPRLYHSTALLLPDTSVLVAGSNPNVDVNLTVPFPTTYEAEIFYPPYFSASTRPNPSGVPSKLTYGGAAFDITIPASSYSGSANAAADSAMVSVVRAGWNTHAMSMGQRFLQLRNTYTVQSNGAIVLHVSQMPPNSNIFQPGPAFIHVVINGIPSNGTYAIIGSGAIEKQTLGTDAALPASVRLDSAQGSADGSTTGNGGNSGNDNSSSKTKTATIVGAVVGSLAVLALLGTLIFFYRRRSAAAAAATGHVRSSSGVMTSTGAGYEGLGGHGYGVGASLHSSNATNTKAAAAAAGGVGASRPLMNADRGFLQADSNWNTSSVSLLPAQGNGASAAMGREDYYDPYSEVTAEQNLRRH